MFGNKLERLQYTQRLIHAAANREIVHGNMLKNAFGV
jgi:hypothetical protein